MPGIAIDNSLQPNLRVALAKLSESMDKAAKAWLEHTTQSENDDVRSGLLSG
jgi:hypothetical protein